MNFAGDIGFAMAIMNDSRGRLWPRLFLGLSELRTQSIILGLIDK